MRMPNTNDKNQNGKILRVKQGYNPNSSSMGSIVLALPAAILAATIGFGAVSAVILSAFLKSDDNTKKDDKKTAVEKMEKQER